MNQDFPILAAVAASPSHPFAVLDHLQAIGVKATRSTVYRRVDALIADGLLESQPARSEEGQPRRTLQLTAAGRQIAAKKAAEAIANEPLESPIFALALTCVDELDTEALLGVLRARMASTARKLTQAERELSKADPAENPWQLAGQERQVAHLKADISWLQSMMGRGLTAERTETLQEGEGKAAS